MSESKQQWEAGWGGGLTGPTTPGFGVFCGGRDWPFTPVHCGMETIAVCPQQDGQPGSDAKHARLIAAAPDFRAVAVSVLEWWEKHQYDECGGEDGGIPDNVYDEEPQMVVLARAALAKADEVKP